MDKVEFYLRCAEIVGVDHNTVIQHPLYRRNRWNNRRAGNGRFEGVGLIRFFGGIVHIAITNPIAVQKQFDTPEAALEYLAEIFQEQ